MNDDIGVGLAKLLDEGIVALCHQTEEVAGVVLRNDYLCLGFRGDGGSSLSALEGNDVELDVALAYGNKQ